MGNRAAKDRNSELEPQKGETETVDRQSIEVRKQRAEQ